MVLVRVGNTVGGCVAVGTPVWFCGRVACKRPPKAMFVSALTAAVGRTAFSRDFLHYCRRVVLFTRKEARHKADSV